MSASLAAAKKRRANIQEPPRVVGQQPGMEQSVQPPIAAGLTLPQVIQVVDNRLIILEKFMREVKETGVRVAPTASASVNSALSPVPEEEGSSPIDISDIVEEFDNRYKLLAQELADMKNIVMKLQSYTMDVNKTLLEERVRIFSDLDNKDNDISTENV